MVNTTSPAHRFDRRRPLMNPDAVIQSEHWRIGILTDSLVRLEWSDDATFVDGMTQIVVNRDFGDPPEFEVRRDTDGRIDIETEHLRISYDGKPFSREGLNVTVKDCASQRNVWHYGDAQTGNLGGTVRTLDQIDGATALDPGLISGDGWAIIDDSRSALLEEMATTPRESFLEPFATWMQPKAHDSIDLYCFGYANRIHDALRDYYTLTGPQPLLPRYALGNWWSRYHRYDADEYRTLVERFESERLPFTVAVLDMDWHLTDVDPKYGSGWTGFTWNRELFADPEEFLGWLHAKGLHATLNLHPRDGIRAFEECYARVCRVLGVDPAQGAAVEFDATSPAFMAVYFDQVLHPLEEQGVDFWWIDWQQGSVTRQPGVDPLWMLNHLHYLDSARRGDRPITFSRYAGYGSHRYPIGFSGDTVVSWESLRFQPYFTAMASNIGYGWWSHDIGGHMFGERDEDLQVRWYQLGAFSPINRLHSSDSPFNGKEPWRFHEPARTIMGDMLRLRHALIPYLYTMNRRAAFEGLPLIEPMYWDYSGGNVPTEFQFGTQLIVSPIVEPMDAEACRAKASIWFPHGQWFDFFDGRRYVAELDEGRMMGVWRTLDRMPVFAKAGGIIPMQRLDDESRMMNAADNPQALTVLVFPGANGEFTLWEDDGAVQERARWAATTLALDWPGGVFTVGAVAGAADAVPARRAWRIVFRGVARPDGSVRDAVTVTSGGMPVTFDVFYDEATLSLSVDVVPTDALLGLRVAVRELAVASAPTLTDAFKVLNDAHMRYFTKESAWRLIRREGVHALSSLHTLEMPPGDYGEPEWFSSHMPSSVIEVLGEILLRE